MARWIVDFCLVFNNTEAERTRVAARFQSFDGFGGTAQRDRM